MVPRIPCLAAAGGVVAVGLVEYDADGDDDDGTVDCEQEDFETLIAVFDATFGLTGIFGVGPAEMSLLAS